MAESNLRFRTSIIIECWIPIDIKHCLLPLKLQNTSDKQLKIAKFENDSWGNGVVPSISLLSGTDLNIIDRSKTKMDTSGLSEKKLDSMEEIGPLDGLCADIFLDPLAKVGDSGKARLSFTLKDSQTDKSGFTEMTISVFIRGHGEATLKSDYEIFPSEPN